MELSADALCIAGLIACFLIVLITRWYRRPPPLRPDIRSVPHLDIDQLIELLGQHQFAAVLNAVEDELKLLPDGGGLSSYRFHLLFIAAEAVRKSSGDHERELQFLRQCVPLLETAGLSSTAPDSTNLVYKLHMNHGNTAARMGLFEEAATSHDLAYSSACEPATKLKTLIAAIKDRLRLRQYDAVWPILAKALAIDDHPTDPITSSSTVTPRDLAILRAQLCCFRALRSIHEGDLPGGRLFARRAFHYAPRFISAQQMLAYLGSANPDLEGTLSTLWNEDKAPAQSSPQSLRPLPLDL